VKHVEDWAEIRRLHRAEQMPIKVIARDGVFAQHGEGGDRLGWAAAVRTGAGGVDRGWVEP
jgi:hypothetical protein